MADMTRHRVRHLPVVEDGRLQGIVSIGDVVKHRLDELEMEANILRESFLARH
jgi:CBS domain-containing protein